MDTTAPRLEFSDVSKQFVSGNEIVRAADGVSLTIEAGEMVAIYGPSGSGKSTLLNIAAGMVVPDHGSVLVDGRNVTKLGRREADDYRLRTLGWVQQGAHLIGGASALENAAMKLLLVRGSDGEAQREARPLLERLGLGARLASRADTLSEGERQRVAIARALSLDPGVILADEPTGSLDTRRSREVLELLRAETHARQAATALVTHDEHASAYADRIYILSDGRLQSATPAAVAQQWA